MQFQYLDAIVLAIIALSVAVGWFRGALNSILHLLALVASAFFARGWSLRLAQQAKAGGKLIPELLYYSESDAIIADTQLYRTDVSGMTGDAARTLLDQADVTLRWPLHEHLSANIDAQRFAQQGVTRLGDYLAYTIVEWSILAVLFLFCFAVLYAAITIVINIMDNIFELPVFKYGDSVVGAGVALVWGGLLATAFMLLVPVVQAYAPFEQLQEMVDLSTLAARFGGINLLSNMIGGYIP